MMIVSDSDVELTSGLFTRPYAAWPCVVIGRGTARRPTIADDAFPWSFELRFVHLNPFTS